ncbi:hypothetical protein OG496_10875 [Streptomyces sp. NBC_00988]|uniref:hypothetical protein n=1 Tax=Streptomyces sp. NBC_00988 TaxID=2903704 RepID=UPI00386EFBC2|nr:hypothetical protein OG496_10875 [Streptomyces sp. NBC_00988]
MSRFAHDVLGQPRVQTVIVLEGINDTGATGAQITADYQSTIDEARGRCEHRRHDPADDAHSPQPRRPSGPPSTTGSEPAEPPGGIDFDTALRDPANTGALPAAYASGDHLHPNSAGGGMANAVDPSPLAP